MFTLPFHVIGCSHERTEGDVIGRLTVAETELTSLLRDVFAAGMPCVLLSTCNRTELYWWGAADAAPIFRAWVAGRVGAMPHRIFERRDADLAVRHLFAVAAGLRSQRLGEREILGQARGAWMAARDAGVTVPQLDALFQRGIQAARRIRARAGEEVWGRSLGEAAASLLDTTVTGGWSGRRVLVVGSGAAAESSARAIAARSPRSLAISSRTDERASALASQVGAETVPWAARSAMLRAADVVIFATRSQTPVVSREEARECAAARGGEPAWWLDLGVPPNVEPHRPDGAIALHTLGDLPADMDVGAHGIAEAESALQGELARFANELHRRTLAQRLPLMESIANEVARDTVERLRVSLGEGGMSDALTPALDAAAADVARRMTRLLLREIAAVDRRERAAERHVDRAAEQVLDRALPISAARAS